MTDLSILIPARNEIFLAKTIQDILANARGSVEVIAVLDGAWADPPIADDPRVTLIYHPVSVGQRAATNEAARMATGKYLMKCDAHCAFAPGFDVEMLALMAPDITMVPVMRNLHAFDWVCEEGHRRYQGPSGPCEKCGKPTMMDVVWIAKNSPQSTAYRFDRNMHFQYWNDWGKRQQGDLTETMSLQGSCFLLTREKYFELDICSEEFNSWGQQGVEVACKTWLSGGRVMVNRRTWYAHMFRTQGGDFSFPYPNPETKIQENRELSRELFERDGWPGARRSFTWMIEHFNPPEWKIQPAAKEKKGIVYYTDNRLERGIAQACRQQLKKAGLPIVSVSLEPLDFGQNICLPLKRGYLTMFRQILAGLEASKAEVIFFAEHDVLYAPGFFDFVPPDPGRVYYNTNVWHVRASDGHALYYTAKRLSQLCAYRDVLIEHYRKRVERVEREGFSMRMGFEPGTHNRPERVDDLKSDAWAALLPNLDIKHALNLTPARWSRDQFRDQRNCRDWKEAESVAPWYKAGEFDRLLRGDV